MIPEGSIPASGTWEEGNLIQNVKNYVIQFEISN